MKIETIILILQFKNQGTRRLSSSQIQTQVSLTLQPWFWALTLVALIIANQRLYARALKVENCQDKRRQSDCISPWSQPLPKKTCVRTRKSRKQRRERGLSWGSICRSEQSWSQDIRGPKKQSGTGTHTDQSRPCFPIWQASVASYHGQQGRNLAARNRHDGTAKKAGGLPLPSHGSDLWNMSLWTER